MSSGTSDFDPYHKWLGIPPAEQPANHYKLLGITLFESDPEVIAAAADRQMSHVKSFATGKYADHSQLLLNELSKARVCLLNPKLRPLYDAQLRKIQQKEKRELFEAIRDAEPQSVTQPATHSPQVVSTTRPSESREALEALAVSRTVPAYRKRRRRSPLLLNLVILVAGAGLVGGLLWYAKQTGPPTQIAGLNSDPAPPVSENSPNRLPLGDNDNINEPQPPKHKKAQLQPKLPPRPNPRNPDQQPAVIGRPQADNGNLLRAPSDNLAGLSQVFRDMPKFISLPTHHSGPLELADYGDESRTRLLELELLSPEYLRRSNRRLAIYRRTQSDSEVHWHLYDEPEDSHRAIYEGEENAANPIAMMQAKNSQLRFAWLPEAASQQKAERLQACMLRLKVNESSHVLQLLKPATDEEFVTIGNWDEKYEHSIPIESITACPPPSEIRLRLKIDRGFPINTSSNGNSDRLAADEKLYLIFSSCSYAGLGIYWEAKGKLLVVNVAPGFRLASYPDELQILSRSRLAKAEKRLDYDKRKAAREYTRRVRDRSKLQNQLTQAENMNITLPGGGTTVQRRQRKQAAINTARAQIAANESRITILSKLAPLVAEDENSRLPALNSLVNDLEDRAKIGFELYLPVGNREVLLYSKGPEVTR